MQHFAKEIITRLAQAQVEFVVVGGVSAVLQGVPITTIDVIGGRPRTLPGLLSLLPPSNRARAVFHPTCHSR